MSENENFEEEEIIWSKIEDNSWWPSIILSKIKNINKNEYEYEILSFANNIKSKINKNNILKFDNNYKQYSKTKNKELLEIIKKVKELYDIKDIEKKNKKIKEYILQLKNKDNKENINESSSETSKTKEKSGISMKKRIKLKKSEDKIENEIIYKICNFLRHITICLIKRDTNYNFEQNKKYISNIFKYLKEYKIQEPIEFLKKTNLGKYIKYIIEHVPNEEIKEEANEVNETLENQVFAYLVKQK